MLANVGGSLPNGAAAEEGEPELGRFLSSGEVPHAQACVLYVLRVGIIERLGEAGQVRPASTCSSVSATARPSGTLPSDTPAGV